MVTLKVPLFLWVIVLVDQTPVYGRPVLGLPQIPSFQSLLNPPPWKRTGFFTDNPLSTVQRSFQDIQSNIGRSMSSLLAAGSAMRNRMFGMITGATKQGSFPSYKSPQPVRVIANNNLPQHLPHSHTNHIDQSTSGQTIPNVITFHEVHPQIDNIIGQVTNTNEYDSYGAPVGPLQTEYTPSQEIHAPESNIEDSYGPPITPLYIPVEDDSYGAPVAPLKTEYNPIEDLYIPESNTDIKESYVAAVAPVYTPVKEAVKVPVHEIHTIPKPEITVEHPKGGHNQHVPNILGHNNDIDVEKVIHPGGSTDIDVHKVEVLGAASVVQASSASVPDQEHPEKYQNFDSDLLQDVVEVNLWYKDTHKLKHHEKGQKHKVIPHLLQR